LTFTSTKGYSVRIDVEFTDVVITGIVAGNIPDTDTFASIFPDEKSTYFYIDTLPTTTKYSYGLKLISGTKGGIELFDYDDANLEGNLGFYYSILGKTPGDYTFKFYVIGREDLVTEKTYSITVDTPYTKDYITTNIVGKKYTYSTGTMDFSPKFDTATSMTITKSVSYDTDKTATIAYHIEEGKIVIDADQTLTDMYYAKVPAGNIYFARDFSQVSFYVTLPDTVDTEEHRNYTKITLTKELLASEVADYVNGKSYTQETFSTALTTKVFVVLSFNNGKGSMVLSNVSTKAILGTVNYDYTYAVSNAGNFFTLTNITGTSATGIASIKDNQLEYNSSFKTIVTNLTIVSSSNQFPFKI